MGTEDTSDRPGRTLKEMGWKPARKNYFPPPKDLPDYAARPLPPRPASSSSSIYDSDQGTQPLTQHQLFAGAQEDARLSTNFSGSVDESALRLVRPPSIVVDTARQQEQDEIVSPQPRHPGHKVLTINTQDDTEVSPILTPPSGKYSYYQHTVSPLSPDGSIHSFNTAVSELNPSSHMRPNSWAKEQSGAGTEERRPSREDKTPEQATIGFRPLTSDADSLHPRVQKINLRYSDPGSPAIGVADPARFGEPGPDVGSSTLFGKARTGNAQPTTATQGKSSQHNSWGHGAAAAAANDPGRKVAFAGSNIDTFSHRAAPSGTRHAQPPPLKLSERPLADNSYVRTPFPKRTDSDYSQKSVFDEDDDADAETKHSRRVSGLSGFAKSLRSATHGSSGGSSSSFAPPDARKVEDDSTSRASPVPMVKSMISKAKSGLKLGSDDSKKEKKRENLKRQIKVETPGE